MKSEMKSQSQLSLLLLRFSPCKLMENNLKKKEKKKKEKRKNVIADPEERRAVLKTSLNTPSDVFLSVLMHFHSFLKSSTWNYILGLSSVPLRFSRFLNTTMISQRVNLFVYGDVYVL